MLSLLNSVRATPTETCDAIDLWKEEAFTVTEVAAAIQRLKSGKAAGEVKFGLKCYRD